MATYNFKSVGKTKEELALEVVKKTVFPYGIKTPVSIGEESILEMNYNIVDQIADNLKNLLLTNWGERLGLYSFGANLRPLTTEFVSQDDFDSEAINRIKNAVTTWMPYIDLEDFTSAIDRNEKSNTAVIKINITYNIPSLKIKNKAIQIVLYAF